MCQSRENGNVSSFRYFSNVMCKDEGPEGEAQSRVEKGRSAVGFNESIEKQEKSEYQNK